MTHPNTRGTGGLVPWMIYLIFFAVLNETVFNVSTPMIGPAVLPDPLGGQLDDDDLHGLLRDRLGHLRQAGGHLSASAG